MPSYPADHWLWLGLGVVTFFVIQHISHSLQNIRDLTIVNNPPQPTRIVPATLAHQEDAIKTSSLLILATSHNTEIRSSATRILCTRFYASPAARKALIRDLESSDEDVKRRAQLAFNLLCEMGVWKKYSVPPPRPRGAWRFIGQARADSRARRNISERELRRRRREAVVIHDGGGAVGREDVYMRDQEGRMEADRPRGSRSSSEVLLRSLLVEQQDMYSAVM